MHPFDYMPCVSLSISPSSKKICGCFQIFIISAYMYVCVCVCGVCVCVCVCVDVLGVCVSVCVFKFIQHAPL